MDDDRLHQLHREQGQSPWLDNLRRGWVTDGELARWRDRGVRGITSNPTIFQKAIEGSPDYDEQFNPLISDGASIEAAYWALVTQDVESALEIFRPVYDESEGVDGFVSLEVAPGLARDTDGTIEAARKLHATIDEPNLLVKIPATAEGVPAIEQMISEGRSINVTLIFSLDRYADVMEAYIAGLEAYAASGADDLAKVASVASFFVSRVDTEVDRRLEEIGTEEALFLRGTAAIAQARAAYAMFLEKFAGPRWEALAAQGARVQRPLWASTSTKNAEYPDTVYVDSLIGPDTVNTIPDATLDLFLDHGTVVRTIDNDPGGPEAKLQKLAEAGVDLTDVAQRLEDEGVASFGKSFDELLAALDAKAKGLAGG
jgi:transaldolase